jgi:hypothetical protein
MSQYRSKVLGLSVCIIQEIYSVVRRRWNPPRQLQPQFRKFLQRRVSHSAALLTASLRARNNVLHESRLSTSISCDWSRVVQFIGDSELVQRSGLSPQVCLHCRMAM